MEIRDKRFIRHDDVVALNFIRNPGAYLFRRYYLNGLRSHIMEVLDPQAVAGEQNGMLREGVRIFPKAQPVKMLRIFRSRFGALADVWHEIERFKIAYRYLGSRHLALSNEFVVEYHFGGRREIMLCGLQEYVAGVAIDPWTPMSKGYVAELVRRLVENPALQTRASAKELVAAVRKSGLHFIAAVKKMVLEAGYIPDIAGVRNLLITFAGEIKLVDINNISAVNFSSEIMVDDKGYPVCDKSVEALYLLEGHLKGRPADKNAEIYKIFLDPARKEAVLRRHQKFYQQLDA